jgi:ketosteroid isomerase-like protein
VDHTPDPSGTEVVDRLLAATDAHDLDALVDCFADDYTLTSPAHPARSFTGRDQVRRNWAAIFAGVPDVTTTVRARAAVATPGPAHEVVGVMVFGVRDDRIVTGRFFLEPVDHAPLDADAAVRAAMPAPSS